MARIEVGARDDGSFAVEVHTADASTDHVVVVPSGFAARVGWEGVSSERLVAASFEFLLERESPTSILRRFELDEITRYFPEYPDEIRQRVPRNGPS